MLGCEYAAILREAADFFEAHTYVPVPEMPGCSLLLRAPQLG